MLRELEGPSPELEFSQMQYFDSILLGDCEEVLKGLPKDSIDLIFTSPPYADQRRQVVGQKLWYLVSENKDLYTDIIEPIGHRAKEHNDNFLREKSQLTNRLTRVFIEDYCHQTGAIDWLKLVQFNSGNYDMDKFLQE